MLIIEAKPCQDITDFAAEMVAAAWRVNGIVLGEFNEHTLEARPGMTREQVLLPWNDAQRKSYRGD